MLVTSYQCNTAANGVLGLSNARHLGAQIFVVLTGRKVVESWHLGSFGSGVFVRLQLVLRVKIQSTYPALQMLTMPDHAKG